MTVNVERIRELARLRIPQSRIAALLGYSFNSVERYSKGITPREAARSVLQADEIDLVQAYILCGYRQRETAEITGVGRRSVERHARGLWRFRPVEQRSRLNPAVVASWRARRRAGEALSSIAADGEATRQIIARYTADIEIRAKHPTTFDRGRIVELAAKGLSDAQIAARLGCSPALPWHYRKDLAA